MLPRDLIVKVFSHLGTPRDLAICSAVCRLFADVASEPELWHELAVHKYGTIVADKTIYLYEGNWKNMLKDDNKRGALPTLTFSKPCFRWDGEENRGIADNRFDCCIVTGVQWDRQNGKVRVYLDARGETDLSHPRKSALLVAARETGNVRQYKPESWLEDVGKNGHYKGCLVFDAALLARGHCGFCYYYVYWPVGLLGGTLDSIRFDHYTLDGSLFESDTPEIELARWEGVAPERVLLRPDWWV